MSKSKEILLSLLIIVIFLALSIYLFSSVSTKASVFNGQRAFEDVEYQLGLGPRILGSAAHENTAKWIISRMQNLNWEVYSQETIFSEAPVKNIIARRGTGTPWIIIASHYDSRIYADQDSIPEKQKLAVPGANDGASSVAILLELARTLPARLDKQIWLVFFDAEDNGNINGFDWCLGSQYFTQELIGKPDSVVILDMVGDKDLNIYMEGNSNQKLNQEIWDVATKLGYKQFIPSYKYNLMDDHIPFINAGITAVDIIDFDYPYWHTTQDTLDKVSADSLKVIGDTMLKWLELYSK